MMQPLRTLVRAYCTACLLAGILQQLGPAGTSRKLLKSVTGLYLIASVLLCAGQLRFSAPAPVAAAPPAASVQAGQDTLFQQQIAHKLEEVCGQILRQAGIQAEPQVTVSISPAGQVQVETICLAGKQDSRAEALLAIFDAHQILWKTGDAYAYGNDK